MRFALTLLDMMSAGVFAGTLVQIARRRLFLRIPNARFYAVLAAAFIAGRLLLPGNTYVSAVIAALGAIAVVAALARARAEPFGALLVAVPSLVIVTIVLADVYEPQAREPLRALVAPLLAIPALAGVTRLFYLYGKRYRSA